MARIHKREIRLHNFESADQVKGSIKRNVTTCTCARSAELVAILLHTGLQGMNVVQLAQKVLREHGGWVGLQRLTFEEITHIYGLGEAKAA